MPLHVRLEEKLFAADFTFVSHIPRVFPLMLFQVMPFPVNFAAVRKLAGVFLSRILVADVISLPVPLCGILL